MNRMRFWIAAAIIALVIIIGFALSVPHTRDIGTPRTETSARSIPAVSLHDVYKRGVHTITGSLMVPDACGIVSAEASVATSSEGSAGIVIAVSVESGGGVCLELPTKATFSTTVTAPANLPLRAIVNGEVATTSAS